MRLKQFLVAANTLKLAIEFSIRLLGRVSRFEILDFRLKNWLHRGIGELELWSKIFIFPRLKYVARYPLLVWVNSAIWLTKIASFLSVAAF